MKNAGNKEHADAAINHSACMNFLVLLKRWGRGPADIFNFTVMVKRGGR
jgi:hypothetical protein